MTPFSLSEGLHSPFMVRIRRSSALRALVIVLALSGLALGCGTTGRELREPSADTRSPRSGAGSLTTNSQSAAIGTSLSLRSPAFEPGGKIPALYTCYGSDISPPFTIAGVAPGTVELLLMITNNTDLITTNWIVAKIPPSTTAIDAGKAPSGSIQIPTSSGSGNYTGPCPEKKATYDFSLYTFDRPTNLNASSSLNDVANAIATATRTIALTGIYEKK